MALADEQTFPHEGTLQFLDNQLDPSTGTIRGRAVFRNPDRRLTPGLFVRLRLPGTVDYPGVLVEDRAIGTDLDRRFVLVVGADKTIESRTRDARPVGRRPARRAPRRVKAGELVVVNGLQRVRPRRSGAPRRWSRWAVRNEVLVVLHHPADLRRSSCRC